MNFHFNPRPPWGGRPIWPCIAIISRNFNPRPPWGGRRRPLSFQPPRGHFNPRPPWGGRRTRKTKALTGFIFQSTPSVGRATMATAPNPTLATGFQSTPSVGRATRPPCVRTTARRHFNPRPPWGGRRLPIKPMNTITNFNPRPPWGGRLNSLVLAVLLAIFQSTPSVGRATLCFYSKYVEVGISIHALRGEGDYL